MGQRFIRLNNTNDRIHPVIAPIAHNTWNKRTVGWGGRGGGGTIQLCWMQAADDWLCRGASYLQREPPPMKGEWGVRYDCPGGEEISGGVDRKERLRKVIFRASKWRRMWFPLLPAKRDENQQPRAEASKNMKKKNNKIKWLIFVLAQQLQTKDRLKVLVRLKN